MYTAELPRQVNDPFRTANIVVVQGGQFNAGFERRNRLSDQYAFEGARPRGKSA